jgi:hypothetical protein
MTSLKTLNTKVAVNKLRFLLVTHTVYSNARFDRYQIFMSGQGAEKLSGQIGQTDERSSFKGRICTTLGEGCLQIL